MRELDGHVTAEVVYGHVSTQMPGVSLPTVYAALELLQQLGVIRRVATEGGTVVWDARVADHHHAVCTRCGVIVDVDAELDQSSVMAAAQDAGFAVDDAQLVVPRAVRRLPSARLTTPGRLAAMRARERPPRAQRRAAPVGGLQPAREVALEARQPARADSGAGQVDGVLEGLVAHDPHPSLGVPNRRCRRPSAARGRSSAAQCGARAQRAARGRSAAARDVGVVDGLVGGGACTSTGTPKRL